MNRKTIISLILILNLVGPVFLIWADTDQGRPENSVNYQVVSAYTDGTFNYNHPAISIARSDRTVTGGILIKDLNISGDSKINSAILSVYYWNNINYSTSNINVNIRGVYGSPDDLDYDSIVNGVTTPASVNFNVSAFDAGEGWYNITLTDVIQQLVLYPGYNQGDNFIIKTLSIPAQAPGDPAYNYQISGSVFPENHHRPILYVDYTPGVFYEGWEITPGTGGGGSLDGLPGVFEKVNSTTAFDDNQYLYAGSNQKRIVYSNYSGLWYLFHTDENTASMRYTSFDSNGVFNENGADWIDGLTYDYDLQDYDICVSPDGKRLYALYAIDVSAPYNNAKPSTSKDGLVWEVWNITLSGELEFIDDYYIPGESPFNGYTRYQYCNMECMANGWQVCVFDYYTGSNYYDRIIVNPDRDSFNASYSGSLDEAMSYDPGYNRVDTYAKVPSVQLSGEYGALIHYTWYQGSGLIFYDAYNYIFDVVEAWEKWNAGGYWWNATDWDGDYDTTADTITSGTQSWFLSTGAGYYGNYSDAIATMFMDDQRESVIVLNNLTADPGVPYFDYEDDQNMPDGSGVYFGVGSAGYNHTGLFYLTNNTVNLRYVPYDDRYSLGAPDYGTFNLTEAVSVYNFTEPIYAKYTYNPLDDNAVDFPRDFSSSLISYGISGHPDPASSVQFFAILNRTAPTDRIDLFRYIFYNSLTGGGGGNATYTPPPGVNYTQCVQNYLDTNFPGGYNVSNVQEAIDYCDSWIPADDPDPEGSGSWSASRKQFKLYFLLIGIALVAVPWLLFALSGDMKFIGWIVILNSLGIALLIEFMRL